ncbi:MAG: NADH-quinone oxidoreductase subunit L [Saprospiraceae bacterium]|nr:NADH-quinone oxidoreductase subunit L [Saprospiraceae bacterium]
MNPELLIHLILWSPLLGFVLNGVFGSRYNSSIAGTIACLGPLVGFIATVLLYFSFQQPIQFSYYKWFGSEDQFSVDFSVMVDQLTLLMLFVVTGVGTLIHVYSLGYMGHDKGFVRFMAYLNLFIFSMLLLIMGSNLVMLFAGWEGVGLCSFLLIGFWFKNADYNKAARKAFVMNRVGDLGFILGIFLTGFYFKSLDIPTILSGLQDIQPNDPQIVLITILLFIGVCGKSAQIPLFTWLPDAMAGPTPVSALIHAATMVTAGIYLVARMSGLYNLAPFTLDIVLWVGLATAFISASIALKQNDIKKVLAYSTVSQLGYMAVALGCAAYSTAIFHVMTHAFFKALLFLGAGSVIHGLHGEQDISKMGGLHHKMKSTHLVFLVATLAIIGCPPLAGFFSKDEILAAAYNHGKINFIILAVCSVFTAWYMLRLYFGTFHGTFRGTDEVKNKIHESPMIMLAPLFVLAILSAVGGFAGMPDIISEQHYVSQFLKPAVSDQPHHVSHFFEYVLWAVTVLALVSIAWFTNRRYSTSDPSVFDKSEGFPASLLKNKYYLDEIYDTLFANPLKALGTWSKNVLDPAIIDRVVKWPGNLVTEAGQGLKPLQSGMIGWYVMSLTIGLLTIIYLFLF